ncbi:MAG: GIY-YIG nuclease family protein [Deltaproteobacteria bacterium]|nr:GIY-YIG nuclease family protein [Deltaproteobacteria bacterium]
MGEWSVYIIRCDERFLYTGITTDVARRVGEHSSGDRKAAKYTRTFSSIALVYEVLIGSRSQAAKIEYRIKKLPRQKKENIILRCLGREELLEFVNVDQETK